MAKLESKPCLTDGIVREMQSRSSTTPSEPRISLVIACKNAHSVLQTCLSSILSQDYSNFEVVVVDGASSDGTQELIKAAEPAFGERLVWMSEPDSGIGDAWNKAVARCSGEWLLFLGADDVLVAVNSLSVAAPFLTDGSVGVVYGPVQLHDPQTGDLGKLAEPWSPRSFRRCRRNLPHQGVFHRKSLFAAIGAFDTTLRFTSDYDFLLRALKNTEPVYVPSLCVSSMQIGGLSGSRRNAHKVVAEHMRLFRRHVGGIPVVLTWWFFKGLAIALLYRMGGDPLALQISNRYRSIFGEAPLRF